MKVKSTRGTQKGKSSPPRPKARVSAKPPAKPPAKAAPARKTGRKGAPPVDLENRPPEKCERCNGQGCIPVLCPICDGKPTRTFRACKRCKGDGYIDVVCKFCKGTGEVIEEEIQKEEE